MSRIEITRTGKSFNQIMKESIEIGKVIRQKVDKLAEPTKREMDKVIESSRKRVKSPHTDTNAKASKMSLIKGIQIERFENGWGLGRISYLKSVCPHFRVINQGGYLPPSTRSFPKLKGHFEPLGSRSRGIFTKGSPWFSINPTKPITGIDYIEKTSFWLRHKVRTLRIKK